MAIGDKLYVADKQTLDQVKALIGTASPSGGDLTTLFKSMKLIADYVDTLEARLGINTDPAGSGTIFSRLTQIAGYTDTVLQFLQNPGQLYVQRNLTFHPSLSWTSLLDLTGRGKVFVLNQGFRGVAGEAGAYVRMEFSITIDGVTRIFSSGYAVIPANTSASSVFNFLNNEVDANNLDTGEVIYFQSNFVCDYKIVVDSGALTLDESYEMPGIAYAYRMAF